MSSRLREPSSARRVLVVDDDKDLCDNLHDILADEGWLTAAAHSLRSGLLLAEEWQPAVALVDLRLPDGAGTAALLALKRIVPDCVCIMMTAHADLDSAILSLAKGARLYLQKPIRPDELIGLLEGIGEHLRLVEEKRSTQDALRESEARYRLLAEGASDVISKHDGEGAFSYASPSAAMVFGRKPDELLGTSIAHLAHEGDLPALEAALEAARRGGACVISWRARLPDGTPRWIESAMRGLDGGIVASSRDIDERKAVQEELERARDAAEAANRGKSNFLANMSHEIRTPMNAIIGMTDLVLAGELTVEQREYLGMVKSSANALLTVVNDVLDLAKIEAGRLQVEQADFELQTCVEQSVRALSVQAWDKALVLSFEVLPSTPRFVRGDAIRLRQVLTNLVGNAIKFTDWGEISVRAAVDSIDDLGCVVRFEVTDTGIGIPQDKLGALFTSFGQLDGSTTRKFGGAGLGLAISKQIVERMGGSIGVVSAQGKGSTFWFTVRFGNAESAATAEIPLERSASEVESLPPARVLLAEDNKTNQVLVRSLLERKGCSVDIVATGFEAVEAVARGGYDLVLMDVQMPGMDGFEATRRIRSHERSDSRPAVPIVALTAHALKGDREACLSCGMDEYISKPIEASQLYAAIRRFASEAPAARRLG